MRHILLSLLILVSTALCAEDAAPSTKALPADAQQIVDREAATEQTLQAELDTKVAKLKHELATRLKPCEERAIHAGNLDQAEAVKAEIAKLKETPGPAMPAREVSLTSLKPLSMEGPYNPAVVASEKDTHGPGVVLVDGKPCWTYIWAHAPSVIVFRIPEGAHRFKAFGSSFSAQGMRFIVSADGQALFTSQTLSNYPSGRVPIDVVIPDGAQKLTLTVDAQGSNNAAHSYWGTPVFMNE